MIEKELAVFKNSRFLKLNSIFREMNVWRYIGLMVLITFLVELPLELLKPITSNLDKESTVREIIIDHPSLMLLMIGIIGPLFETFVFQVAIIRVLQWIKRIPNFVIILVSATIFMLVHFPDNTLIFYIWVFILGCILAYTYIIFQDREEAPFAVVFCIHAFRNMISVFVILATGPISP